MAKKKNKTKRTSEACDRDKASSSNGSWKLSNKDLAAINLICRKTIKRFLQRFTPDQLKEVILSSNYSEDKPLPYHLRLENLVARQYQDQRGMAALLKAPNVSAPHPDNHDRRGGKAIAVEEKGSHSKRGLKRVLTVPSAKPVADYGCKWPGCKTRRASMASLRRHHNVHLETIKCTVCSKCYESPSTLRRHYVCHVDEWRPFICGICGKSFKIKDHRKDHVKRLHSGEEKPFKCPDCPSSAWTRQHIFEHRVAVHGWDWRKDQAK